MTNSGYFRLFKFYKGELHLISNDSKHIYLDHLDGAGLLEEPSELRAVDAERQVADEELHVLGELRPVFLLRILGLVLRRHRDGHGREEPALRRRRQLRRRERHTQRQRQLAGERGVLGRG
jgi:hypothetical protein